MNQQRLVEIGALLTSPINKATVASEQLKDSGKQLLKSLSQELSKEGVHIILVSKVGQDDAQGLYLSEHDMFIGLNGIEFMSIENVTPAGDSVHHEGEYTGDSLEWDLEHVLATITDVESSKRPYLLAKHGEILEELGTINSLIVTQEYQDLFKWASSALFESIEIEESKDHSKCAAKFFDQFVSIVRANEIRESYTLKALELEALKMAKNNASELELNDFFVRVMEFEKLFLIMRDHNTELLSSSISPTEGLECYMQVGQDIHALVSERYEGALLINNCTGSLQVQEPERLAAIFDKGIEEVSKAPSYQPDQVATLIINHLNTHNKLPDSALPFIEDHKFALSLSTGLCTENLLSELFVNQSVSLDTKKMLAIYLPPSKLIDIADALLEATPEHVTEIANAITEVKPEFTNILKSVQISSLISGIGQGRLSAGNFTEQSALPEPSSSMRTSNSL